jgi:hypothetical protein
MRSRAIIGVGLMDAAAVAAALVIGLQSHSEPGHHLAVAQAAPPLPASAARVLEADARMLDTSRLTGREQRRAYLLRAREARRSMLDAQHRRRRARLVALQSRAAARKAKTALQHRSSLRPRHASDGHARRELQREHRREREREAHERRQRSREARERARQIHEQAREQARAEHREAREHRLEERRATGDRRRSVA